MNSVIYYFTGTGNSLNTARIIAKEIGGAKLIAVKENPDIMPAQDTDIIGFVCPVYEWDIPHPMAEFVSSLTINPDAYIFFVATYILMYGLAFDSMKKLIERKGLSIHYSTAIRCVASQCIAYPPFPPEKIMTPYSRKKAISAGKQILNGIHNQVPHSGMIVRLLYPEVITPYMNLKAEYDSGFYTSSKCIGCGICQKVCPCKNITIEDAHPVFHHNCISCNACVAYCPQKAIQFRKPEAYRKLNNPISNLLRLPEKRKRYHHPDISAKDLISGGEDIT